MKILGFLVFCVFWLLGGTDALAKTAELIALRSVYVEYNREVKKVYMSPTQTVADLKIKLQKQWLRNIGEFVLVYEVEESHDDREKSSGKAGQLVQRAANDDFVGKFVDRTLKVMIAAKVVYRSNDKSYLVRLTTTVSKLKEKVVDWLKGEGVEIGEFVLVDSSGADAEKNMMVSNYSPREFKVMIVVAVVYQVKEDTGGTTVSTLEKPEEVRQNETPINKEVGVVLKTEMLRLNPTITVSELKAEFSKKLVGEFTLGFSNGREADNDMPIDANSRLFVVMRYVKVKYWGGILSVPARPRATLYQLETAAKAMLEHQSEFVANLVLETVPKKEFRPEHPVFDLIEENFKFEFIKDKRIKSSYQRKKKLRSIPRRVWKHLKKRYPSWEAMALHR